MKRDECNVSADSISESDRAEIRKFENFIRIRMEHPERDAYAEVYGEVLFDASPPTPTDNRTKER